MKRENILLVDTVGVIYEGRTEKMNPYKERFAVDTPLRTLADAMKGADVFVGVSAKDLVTPDMLKSMADNPIVFAMANPDPEITYDARRGRRATDVIMATGRSDYPNQVNNVLGFPFIFRGALDVRASAINDEMKIAAVRALAALAREDVPEQVLKAYGAEAPRVRPRVPDPEAVRPARAAVGGAGRGQGRDGDRRGAPADRRHGARTASRSSASSGRSREVMHLIVHKAAASVRSRLVFPEGEDDTILRAARAIVGPAHRAPDPVGPRAT